MDFDYDDGSGTVSVMSVSPVGHQIYSLDRHSFYSEFNLLHSAMMPLRVDKSEIEASSLVECPALLTRVLIVIVNVT